VPFGAERSLHVLNSLSLDSQSYVGESYGISRESQEHLAIIG